MGFSKNSRFGRWRYNDTFLLKRDTKYNVSPDFDKSSANTTFSVKDKLKEQ